jgi:hypothetical protein
MYLFLCEDASLWPSEHSWLPGHHASNCGNYAQNYTPATSHSGEINADTYTEITYFWSPAWDFPLSGDPPHDDLMYILESENSSGIKVAGSNVSSSQVTMDKCYQDGTPPEYDCRNVIAPYMILGAPPPPPPPNTIAVEFPQNGATTTDFNAWGIQTFFGSTSTPSGYFRVIYGLSTSSMDSSDTFPVGIGPIYFDSFVGATTSVAISKQLSLSSWAPFYTYFAQAEILDASSTVIATSSIISFDFYRPGAAFTAPSSTTSIASTTLECSGSGLVGDSFCRVSNYLFVPGIDNFYQFSALWINVQNKPPFGYFSVAKNLLAGLTVGTSSIILISASSTAALSGIFSPLRIGCILLIWFLLLFWLFNKFRNIQL